MAFKHGNGFRVNLVSETMTILTDYSGILFLGGMRAQVSNLPALTLEAIYGFSYTWVRAVMSVIQLTYCTASIQFYMCVCVYR